MMLERSFSGRLATVGQDGYPYCIPLLYIWMNEALFLHGTAAKGHLRSNIEYQPKACFEIDEPGQVFDYGRFECDSGMAFASVLLFGQISMVDNSEIKQRFFESFMSKYGKGDTGRPKSFFPRLRYTTVYRLEVERISGKEQVMPPMSEQWPAKDMTKTPNARPNA
jgi:uncharacterized protein